MNRKDYMDGKVDHHTYYLAVADAIDRKALERIVRAHICPDPEKLRAELAKDRHLNGIPLGHWDSCHPLVLSLIRQHGPAAMAISWSGQPLAEGMICWSLSESVCVLKAVARAMVAAPVTM